MENITEFLYQGLAVFLFCTAMVMLIISFRDLEDIEKNIKSNMYDRHVLSCKEI